MEKLTSALILLAVLVLAAASPATAQEAEAFTEERFEALQAEDALVLLDVAADWCPTCAKQKAILEEYRETNPETPITFLRIDFDDQKEWVKAFKAPRQSTLILYRGEEQIWFSVAETSADAIFAQLDAAVADSDES